MDALFLLDSVLFYENVGKSVRRYYVLQNFMIKLLNEKKCNNMAKMQ